MALPKQVRQQIAESKRIEGELRAAAETPPADPAQPPAEAPVAQQPAEPAPAAPVAAAKPVPDARYEELLQQHRSLQGIHRTLVRSNENLQSQAQGLQEQYSRLAAEVEQLRTQKTPPNPTPSVAPITPEEMREFGPDLINVIERKAQEVAAPLNQALVETRAKAEALERRNAELEQKLNGVSNAQAQSAQDAFQARLLALVPDFNTLNYDKKFLSWLSQVDPLDARRRTLQDRLDEATQVGDADAVASFFNTFKSLVAAAPTPAPAPKPDLVAQAQPASRAAPDNAPAKAGRLWTQLEISAFYSDVARGKYTPQDKARIEKEIYAAQKDNRIAA